MKKLVSFFAIALFLSIPLAANADLLGSGEMLLQWDTSLPHVPWAVFYHGKISSSWGYSTGVNYVDIFCISGTGAASGTFGFNTITSTGDYYRANGDNVGVTSALVREAAWVADNWQTYGSRADAQLAIWAIMGVGDYTNYYPKAHTMFDEAANHTAYFTSNWYAAFDGQDYLTPVPEPGILILLGIAMSAIGAASWRIRKL